MKNLEFSQKKWKYVSIALMAILAVGFAFPQASAHVTNSVSHNVQHILDAIAGVDSDIATINTKVDDIKDDLALNKNFYSLSDSLALSAVAFGFDGQRVDITIDCGTVPADSCAFTVENLRFVATGLTGTQECDIFGLSIDGTQNPEVSQPGTTIFGSGTPGNDSTPLIEWGVGPFAASDEVSVRFECTADADPLDATLDVEVAGEMPQGATMSMELF